MENIQGVKALQSPLELSGSEKFRLKCAQGYPVDWTIVITMVSNRKHIWSTNDTQSLCEEIHYRHGVLQCHDITHEVAK